MQTQLNSLLTKRMDRKDFLKHVAIGVVAMTGVNTVLKVINPESTKSVQPSGYGSSSYGGGPTRSNLQPKS